jgi:hypothetical protein
MDQPRTQTPETPLWYARRWPLYQDSLGFPKTKTTQKKPNPDYTPVRRDLPLDIKPNLRPFLHLLFGLIGLGITWVIFHLYGIHPAYSYFIGFTAGSIGVWIEMLLPD